MPVYSQDAPAMASADKDTTLRPALPTMTGIRLLRATQVVLGAVVLLLLAGVLPVPGGGQEAVLRSPLLVLLGLALLVLILVCQVRRRPRLAGLALHGGIALILVGAGLGWWGALQGTVLVPLDGRPRTLQINLGRGGSGTMDAPQTLAARDFIVVYEPPDYDFFTHVGAEDVEHRGTFPIWRDTLDLGAEGRIPGSVLRDAAGGWRDFHDLGAGRILQRGRAAPRHFRVALQVASGDWQDLQVNHPVTVDGWRYHLMSWEQIAGEATHVQLSARRDPGRRWVTAGIWLAIAGALLGALRVLGPRHD